MKVKYIKEKMFDVSKLNEGDKCICHVDGCNNWFLLREWYYCPYCINHGIALLEKQRSEEK